MIKFGVLRQTSCKGGSKIIFTKGGVMKKIRVIFSRRSAALLCGMVFFFGLITIINAQNSTPWRTAQGRACIDTWMRLTISQLNSTDLGQNYNSSKPWRFNQYGLLMGRTMHSNYAPDLFSRYEGRYHWVWAHYNRGSTGYWTGSLSFLNRANITSCKSYVNSCLAGQTQVVPPTPPTPPVPSSGSVFFQSYNYPDRYIRHRGFLGELTTLTSQLDRSDAAFKIVPGLADSRYVSFESVNYPGYYLRHQGFRIKLHRRAYTKLYKEDATFRLVRGLANSSWISFESYNYPGRYIRHRGFHLYLENGNTDLFRKDVTFRRAAPR